MFLHFGYSINPWLHIVVSTVVAMIPAFLSRRFVEQPLLKLKNKKMTVLTRT